MASSDDADRQLNGRRAAHADTRRIGAERIAALVAVADAARLALLVVQEAATAAREDLDAVLRTVRAIDLQKRAAHDAASALDDAGARAAKHLRAVDRLTEAASRSVGAALAASGSHTDETVLEELDSWADLSRLESEGLQQYLRRRWGLAEALESLTELGEAEARRLQQVLERRARLMTTLTEVLTTQAEAARSITSTGVPVGPQP